MKLLAVDVETTGVDFHHGSKPFFVSTCDEDGLQRFWQWEVDPVTRDVSPPRQDIEDIYNLIMGAPALCGHNIGFDVKALATHDERFYFNWPWELTDDTMVQGHLLASNEFHNLTDMCTKYLRHDIEKYEKAIKAATQEARRLVRLKANRSKFGDWLIGQAGHPSMPSMKDETWKADMWLPRAVAEKLGYPDDHPWRTVLKDYANTDTGASMALNIYTRRLITRRGLDKIYRESMRVVPVISKMEHGGVTINGDELDRKTEEFSARSEECNQVCVNLASTYSDYELVLPKSGTNKSLSTFVFDVARWPVVGRTDTGNPSMDKVAMAKYEAMFGPTTREGTFVRNLQVKRKLDNAMGFASGYRKFMVPIQGSPGFYLIYPNLNLTGTDTLRMSSNNPNQQSVSKQPGYNIREAFCPAPGREFWVMDAQNIELRIPAFDAHEEEMMDLFLRPNDPPYYGSYHLLVFDVLHPEKFAQHGVKCKDIYEATWYKWTKNGNFAVQYGAVNREDGEGTADRAYHVPGAQTKIESRFSKLSIHNKKQIAFANKHGYVETMPDRSIDPTRGYPLMCARGPGGRVLPTVPLNYRTQGTAMWWMRKAMVRCQAQLDVWNHQAGREDYRITMQVHDELVFDFPKSSTHPKDDTGLFRRSNLWRAKILQKLMEQGGDDIGIPTPTSCKYHEVSWAEGVAV